MFVYYEDFIKNDKRNIFQMFLSLLKHNSTIFFIFCDCNCDKNSKKENKEKKKGTNDIFTRIAVLVLSFNLFILYNIVTEFDLSSLHYFVHRDDKTDIKAINRFLICLVAFLYIPILMLKYYLSRKEFLWYANRKINEIKEKESKGNLIKRLHNIKSQVNLYKNKKEIYAKRVWIFGSVFLLFNLYLVACFLGIYNNSYSCLLCNVVVTILVVLVVLVGLFSISTICRWISRIELPKEEEDDNDGGDLSNDDKDKNCFKELKEYTLRYLIFKFSQRLNPSYYLYNESEIDEEFKPKKDKYNKKKKSHGNRNDNDTNTDA